MKLKASIKQLPGGRAEAEVREDDLLVWSCVGPEWNVRAEVEHYLAIRSQEEET